MDYFPLKPTSLIHLPTLRMGKLYLHTPYMLPKHFSLAYVEVTSRICLSTMSWVDILLGNDLSYICCIVTNGTVTQLFKEEVVMCFKTLS